MVGEDDDVEEEDYDDEDEDGVSLISDGSKQNENKNLQNVSIGS